MTRTVRYLSLIAMAVVIVAADVAPVFSGDAFSTGPPQRPDGNRLIVWMSDGPGMQPTGNLERFLIDRIGATGDRYVVDQGIARSILRVLGFQTRSVYDPAAIHAVAVAADSRWVLWVKVVSRDLQSKKLLGVPYLFNHRRLDAHVFFDVRLYDAYLGTLIGSKRLKLSDKGEGSWQVTTDERLDPVYNNDQVEIHDRYRRLDWKAAALISGFCADMLHPEHLAILEEEAKATWASPKTSSKNTVSPAVHTSRTSD